MAIFISILVFLAVILIIGAASKNTGTQKISTEIDESEDYQYEYHDDDYYSRYELKKIESAYLYPKPGIKNVHNWFARKKVVLTGDLESYPERNEIAAILWELGADIDTSITENTNIVIVGEEPGPEKLSKLIDLQNQGNKIEIIEEDQLVEKISEASNIDDADESSMEFAMQKFYMTGKFEYFINSNLKLIIKDRGGEVLPRLSQKTTIMLIGYNPDFELIAKAEEWNKKDKANITFVNEEEFLKLAFPDQHFEFEKPIGEKPFEGQKVLITGTFKDYERKRLTEIITLLGGTIVSGLSKKTNVIIKGDKAGPSKMEKAMRYISEGIELNILTEEQFTHILKNVTRKQYKFKK